MTGKDQALFTLERVFAIPGKPAECECAAELIVRLLHSQEEVSAVIAMTVIVFEFIPIGSKHF